MPDNHAPRVSAETTEQEERIADYLQEIAIHEGAIVRVEAEIAHLRKRILYLQVEIGDLEAELGRDRCARQRKA